MWKGRAQEWLFDHGFRLDDAGKVLIPKSKWFKLAGTDRSIRDPKVKTLCVPSDTGLMLLTEHKHFEIVGG